MLGEEVTGVGLLGGSNGEFIRGKLENLSIVDEFVSIKEETRNCIALITKKSASATEVLEAGPTISEDEIALFIKKYEKDSKRFLSLLLHREVYLRVFQSHFINSWHKRRLKMVRNSY